MSLSRVGQKQDLKSPWEDVGLEPPKPGVSSEKWAGVWD